MGQGRSCCTSDKVPNPTDISTAPQEQIAGDISDKNDDIKESSEPRVLGENFDDVSLIALSAKKTVEKTPEWLQISEAQIEMKRCQSNLGLISTWVKAHADEGEGCIDSNEYEKLFGELKEYKNQYGKCCENLVETLKNDGGNWKEKVEHLDEIFGKAEHCNADLERKIRLGKQTSIRMEEFERIAMDVLSISPKDIVELKMPMVLSLDSSEDSDMCHGRVAEVDSSNNPSLAKTWSYEVTIE